MTENKHLTYFKVENFKRFSHFEISDLKQINLIVGDNNVGKTSLLEALVLDENIDQLLFNFLNALAWREVGGPKLFPTNYLRYFISSYGNKITYNIKTANDEKTIALEVKEVSTLNPDEIILVQKKLMLNKDTQKYIAIFDDGINKQVAFLNDQLRSVKLYVPLVPFHLGYKDDLVRFYSEKIQPSKKLQAELVENLKIFISDIEDIDISTNVIPDQPYIVIRLKNRDETMPLTMFGDGAVKLFRILCEIAMCSGSRLLVDEIDTGVYFARFNQYWQTILKAAEANSVQIFATTHSIDCLKYFNEVLKDDNLKHLQKKSKVFALKELPDKTVKAYGYDFENFNSAIENEIEIR